MSCSKIARAHNKQFQQLKRQIRNRYLSTFKQFQQFVQTTRNYENCNCERGDELAKEFIRNKSYKNIVDLANKVDTIISEELYYHYYIESQEPDFDLLYYL